MVVLQFPQWLVKEHHLETGAKLVAVNTFVRDRPVGTDIVRGPKALHDYKNVFPIIVDFVTDDQDRVRQIKVAISDEEWRHCLELGQAYRKQFPSRIRNGSPLFSDQPAE